MGRGDHWMTRTRVHLSDPPQLGEPQAPRRVWSANRVGAGLVLGLWAAMFWILLITGRIHLYLSTRTLWVAPIGAALLTIAAVGRLSASRVSRREPLRRRETMVLAAMVLPIILILALPPATLGSFTVSKKSASLGAGAGLARGSLQDNGAITLLGVFEAENSSASMSTLVGRAGTQVDFIGFVTHDPATSSGEFLLNRWVFVCCAADTLLIQVRVVNAPPAIAADSWVEVQGPVYALGSQVLVVATSVTPTAVPSQPYLTD